MKLPHLRQPTYLASEQGYILLLTMLIGMTLLISLTGIINLSMFNMTSAKRSAQQISSLYIAEAGADNAVFRVNQDNAYAGTNTSCPISGSGSNPVTLFNDPAKGKATYETCIANGTIAREKIIYATGKIYLPANSATPKAITKLKLVIVQTFSGGYGVISGPGGLIMRNSSTITTGPVFVGGYLDMSDSANIGAPLLPVDVKVGNNRCPQPATSTYPQICASGTLPNPVTIANIAHIYGRIDANGQTNTSGMTMPGLTSSSGVPATALPDYDRIAHKAGATNIMTANAASCSNNGTVTWPANTRIVGGNVTLSHNCKATAQGNVWIEGALSMTQKAAIITDASLTSQPTIMVDGPAGITLSNQAQVSANATGIGIQLITFHAAASCSPNCSTVTGTDLASSQNITTIDLNNQGLAAGSTFYARWSKLKLGNSGSIGTIMAQTIELNNSGAISIGTATAGGIYTWDVRYYQKL